MGMPKDLAQAETLMGTKRARTQKVVERGRKHTPLTAILQLFLATYICHVDRTVPDDVNTRPESTPLSHNIIELLAKRLAKYKSFTFVILEGDDNHSKLVAKENLRYLLRIFIKIRLYGRMYALEIILQPL